MTGEHIYQYTYTIKFNTIKFNSKWPRGAAIVRPPNTEYTQSIGACWENLPKKVKIALLQFNYEFGHGVFFSQYDLHKIFKIFTDRKKIVIDGNSQN